LLDEVIAAGKLRTTNVLLAALKQMFRFALAREIFERNPLQTVTKRDAGGKEAERRRTLGATRSGL
jgi:site-specific recombinase XerD